MGVGGNTERALFFNVQANAVDRVHLTLRVQDVSRAQLNFGTTIPTPSEDDFRSVAFSIADIPTDARFRSRLRIYSLRNEATSVVVRLYAARTVTSGLLFVLGRVDPDAFVRTDTYTLEPQTPGEGITVPALVEVPLDLSGVTTEFARVEIEPPAQNNNVWAFVSVTNNEAQHITVLSP